MKGNSTEPVISPTSAKKKEYRIIYIVMPMFFQFIIHFIYLGIMVDLSSKQV